jgi:hypothetical protein
MSWVGIRGESLCGYMFPEQAGQRCRGAIRIYQQEAKVCVRPMGSAVAERRIPIKLSRAEPALERRPNLSPGPVTR